MIVENMIYAEWT